MLDVKAAVSSAYKYLQFIQDMMGGQLEDLRLEGEPERSQCFAIFSRGVATLDEFYAESKTIAVNEGFVKFGLTDCGILDIAKNHYLVLTDDLRLTAYLQSQGVDTVNFNNLRVYNWS
jgi:hypothetical protein